MSGDRHVTTTPIHYNTSSSSGYDTLDHTPQEYTPPVMPQALKPHPLVLSETNHSQHTLRPHLQSDDDRHTLRPHLQPDDRHTLRPHLQPDALPMERQHYSQPVLPPQAPPNAHNYTGPIQHNPNSRPPGVSQFMRPHVEGPREGSISPQLQHANLPGLGPVLILAPSATPYQLDRGSYLYTDEQPMVPLSINNATYWQSNAQNRTSVQGRHTNAQGNPMVVIKADHGNQPQRTGRSFSQPAVNLRRYQNMSQDSTDGRGLDKCIHESESEGDFRRHSVPVPKNLEEVASSLQDSGGYDLPFLSSREELLHFICPICQLVYCHPHLTDCCGGCFCHTCISRHISNEGDCPLCKQTNYRVFIDRNMERRVSQLLIRCPHEGDGCVWTGQLNNLSLHTDLMKGDCEFVYVTCSYCGKDVTLNKLEEHKRDCPRRPYACKFCSYKGIYEDMPSTHWPLCGGYPTQCPNECDLMDMPRRELKDHMDTCSRRPIECNFKFAGCQVQYPRADAHQHEQDSAHQHLVLLGSMVKDLMLRQETTHPDHTLKDLETRLEESEKETTELKRQLHLRDNNITKLQKTITTLQEDYEDMKVDLLRVHARVFTPPFSFTVSKFTELRGSGRQWFSQPFYTYPQGYQMCVSVDCNGSDEGSGTHVSVYANLMKGEFDDDLPWPFCGIVVIQLLNQYGEKGHIVHDVPFSREVSAEIGGRVLEQDLAESGLGVPQFVAHSQLVFDHYSNVGYLKSDCLHFCIVRVKKLFSNI